MKVATGVSHHEESCSNADLLLTLTGQSPHLPPALGRESCSVVLIRSKLLQQRGPETQWLKPSRKTGFLTVQGVTTWVSADTHGAIQDAFCVGLPPSGVGKLFLEEPDSR